MPRNRVIWPEFWGDKKLSGVSRDARLLFIGMWNFSDDYGVIKGKADWIRSNLFEEDDSVSNEMVEEWLGELSTATAIIPFTAEDGKRYYFIKNWDKYQRVDRPSQRRNPEFNETLVESLASHSRHTRETLDAVSSKLKLKLKKNLLEQKTKNPVKKLSTVPTDFEVTDSMRTWAAENGIADLETRTAHFLDHHTAKGSKFKDWRAAWRTWMRKSLEFSKDRAPREGKAALWNIPLTNA